MEVINKQSINIIYDKCQYIKKILIDILPQ